MKAKQAATMARAQKRKLDKKRVERRVEEELEAARDSVNALRRYKVSIPKEIKEDAVQGRRATFVDLGPGHSGCVEPLTKWLERDGYRVYSVWVPFRDSMEPGYEEEAHYQLQIGW